MRETAPHAACPSCLSARLWLLEDRRADVADVLEVGGRNEEVLVDAIATHLGGAPLNACGLGREFPLADPRNPRGRAGGRERREHDAGNLPSSVAVAGRSCVAPNRDGYRASGVDERYQFLYNTKKKTNQVRKRRKSNQRKGLRERLAEMRNETIKVRQTRIGVEKEQRKEQCVRKVLCLLIPGLPA